MKPSIVWGCICDRECIAMLSYYIVCYHLVGKVIYLVEQARKSQLSDVELNKINYDL